LFYDFHETNHADAIEAAILVEGTMSSLQTSAKYLHLTERGQRWLTQFSLEHRATARLLLETLTLVSHDGFARAIEKLIRATASQVSGPIALYATREVIAGPGQSYFEYASEGSRNGAISAVGTGSDLGSEARVAAIIRGIARSQPKKFLNHPNIHELRAAGADLIVVVDDLLGSGSRTHKFIDAVWHHATIKSWWSRKDIKFCSVSYAATIQGEQHVRKHRCRPNVVFERTSPSLDGLPWRLDARENMASCLTRYGKLTSKPHLSLGYQGSCALLVFEHGCPNNAPSVLWAPTTNKRPWNPLFPDRSILPEEQSAFPPEIVRRDPLPLLIAAGQDRVAANWSALGTNPLSENVVIVLALLAKRFRSTEALAYATGFSGRDCEEVIENCIGLGLITTSLRLTESGRAELDAIKSLKIFEEALPDRGSDEYHPRLLRTHVGS